MWELDLKKFLNLIEQKIIDNKLFGWKNKTFKNNFTIGVYGKAGTTKGVNGLISALGKVANEGYEFNFVLVSGGKYLQRYQKKIREQGENLEMRTTFLPFISPWRIPEFIRLCDVVCCLENKFPVLQHSPRLPREILLCGSCLLMSDEIFQKQVFRHHLKNWENFLIVNDPDNDNELKKILLRILDDQSLAKKIGLNGWALFNSIDINNKKKMIDNYESIFNDVLNIYNKIHRNHNP